jgi:hypothetical protein
VADAEVQSAFKLKIARRNNTTKAMTGETAISKCAHPRNRFSHGGYGAHEPCDIVFTVFAPTHLARVGPPVEIGGRGGKRGEMLRFK